MSNIAFVNGKIFTGSEFLNNHTLLVSDGYVHDIVSSDTNISNYEKIDLNNNIICAGFIDLQLNGCGGVLFNDSISLDALSIMHETNIKFGTTSFLPTLITSPEEDMRKAVDVVKEAYKKSPHTILGIHIEGPYISPEKKGIHNPKYMKPLSSDVINFLCSQVKEVPIKITLAPEVNNSEYINILSQAGVVVSIGHTNSTYDEAIEGINSGISCATHLFNTMRPLMGREPGSLGAIFNSPSVSAGIIIDGYHVNYPSVKLAKEIKKDKLFIVTDAVTPMGTDIKEFQFADQTIYAEEGRCVNKDGTLAGANIDMMSSIKNAVEYANIPLSEAIKMATIYPATVINSNNKVGNIRKGGVANLTSFNTNYEVCLTIVNGKITYRR